MTRQHEGLETPKGQFRERRAATWVECRLDRRRRGVGIWFTAGGMELDGSGDIHSIAIAGHPDVLKFCREELLSDNYFHAVLEAVKSVAEKIRNRTGLTDDGGELVDRAFGGKTPMLAINALTTESEKSEQKGFCNLLKGTFGMFRNTTAHAPRLHWQMSKDDAEDLLSMVSLMHRRIDAATMPARI